MWILLLILIAIYILYRFIISYSIASKLSQTESELIELKNELNSVKSFKEFIEDEEKKFEELLKLKDNQNEYIGALIADFKTLHYEKSKNYLENKYNPARVEAQRIGELREKTQYYIKEYENMKLKLNAQELHIIQLVDERASVYTNEAKSKTIEAKKIIDREVLVRKEEDKIAKEYKEFENLLSNTANARPYFAGIMADFLTLHYKRSIYYVTHKSPPALVEAKRIKELKIETKEYIKKLKELEYELATYKKLFPELEDYSEEKEEIIETQVINDDEDPTKTYLSKDEYLSLSETERNQLALDRYINRSKSKWQIGRDFELSVGNQYHNNGFYVEYFGENKGLNDLGRDLITKKNNTVHIIQCKYWSKDKVIHEKHINQLYGTLIAYCIDNNCRKEDVRGCFVTSTVLSDTAKKFAQLLEIDYYENAELKDFPRIKCNIGSQGNKIYHLPFDQQYDNTVIKNKGEFFANTVQEAEEQGFRRAYRWKEKN